MAETGMLDQMISTPITEMFGIRHPVMLAGMNKAASSELAAAISNAGGLGVIGGVYMKPAMLRTLIKHLKSELIDPSLPFGVDLLLPKVGEGARATNTDYTKGSLYELLDVIIEEGAKLFVSAVGVPPKAAVEKLHSAGIPVMNMIGSPNHVKGALEAGVDIICAQGGEGGGHTGEVATSILIPAVVDLVRGHNSPLHGKQVQVVAAGGIFDGRGLAACLSYGASAVWVGTRFVLSEESGASPYEKKLMLGAGFHDTHRTLIYTGRPLRIVKSDYSVDWEENRQELMKEALAEGVLPVMVDAYGGELAQAPRANKEPVPPPPETPARPIVRPALSGIVAGAISEIKPAQEILDNMVLQAAEVLAQRSRLLTNAAKL
eukprot:NODE_8829_length_1467_cov_7.522388.p1 GENE.NODE_8829_length_1467_cov_7.522388~~NODE_8829_length_1467_cov_7.522388.p1  ORF type:complete len:415 (-),score=111.02 NODE_8829_length_1467_cov_7.522388:222-1349(-)